MYAGVHQLQEGPDPATAVAGRARRGAGRDGPQGEAGAAAVAERAREASLVDVDDRVEPACPGRRGDGDQPRKIHLVVAARLRLVRLPDEGQADCIEAQPGQPVEQQRVVGRGEGRELAVTAEVDPTEQHDAAIRADEVSPHDVEHSRVRGVASQGRRCGLCRCVGFAMRQARHQAGPTGEQEQGRDPAPRPRASARLEPYGQRRGKIHLTATAPTPALGPRRFNSSRIREPAPGRGCPTTHNPETDREEDQIPRAGTPGV